MHRFSAVACSSCTLIVPALSMLTTDWPVRTHSPAGYPVLPTGTVTPMWLATKRFVASVGPVVEPAVARQVPDDGLAGARVGVPDDERAAEFLQLRIAIRVAGQYPLLLLVLTTIAVVTPNVQTAPGASVHGAVRYCCQGTELAVAALAVAALAGAALAGAALAAAGTHSAAATAAAASAARWRNLTLVPPA